MSQMQRSSPYDPAPRGTGGTEPPDPNERLKELTIELNEHNARILHLTNQSTALLADITDLSTTVAEVKTTISAYGAALQDLEARLHALQYFYEQKNKMILAAIGDKQGPIDELIREYDYELDRMRDRLRELGEKQEAAQQESQEATAAQNTLQAEYTAVNQYQTNTTAKLTDMETLRAEITQADDNTDVASMYFLVLQFHGRLRETQVITQHQLALDLRHKLGELEAAKELARAKSAALSTVQTQYNAHQTALQTKQSGRRANLLAAVQALFPAPAPATTASGTAGSATPSPAGSSPAGAGAATSGSAATGTATPSAAAIQKK
jgi:vacuolar-type H+-ATPase subunit I/STV1